MPTKVSDSIEIWGVGGFPSAIEYGRAAIGEL